MVCGISRDDSAGESAKVSLGKRVLFESGNLFEGSGPAQPGADRLSRTLTSSLATIHSMVVDLSRRIVRHAAMWQVCGQNPADQPRISSTPSRMSHLSY